jgi:formate dehydrogenase beta subunit
MIAGQMSPSPSLKTVGINIKEKAILYDASKCTACRGCQGACKQWHDLPAEKTKNTGSYQNPKELSPKTWLIIRFDERVDSKGYPVWLFNRQSCFHCDDPDCAAACPTGAMNVRADGVVFVNRELCIGCENCATACPFGVPHIDKTTEKSFKCDFCIDRIDNGLAPACVSSCPSGALKYGEREELLKEAKRRVAQLKEMGFSQANIYGITSDYSTHVILVLPFAPENYSWIPKKPHHTQELIWWKEVFKPLGAITIGASALAALFHYITIGPKRVENTVQDDEER